MNKSTVFNKLNWVYLFPIMFFLVSSCMQINYRFVSPGRVSKKELKAHRDTFNRISDEICSNPQSSYEVIGHGASAWRYYPMGVNKKGVVYGNGFKYKKTPAHGIIELMDSSIAVDSNMSIEIDAQYAPENHVIRTKFPEDGAYILHDIPKWEKPGMQKDAALNYLHNNTIRKAIDHFVKSGYYQKCKIYVEIKVNENCYDPITQASDCKIQCQKLAIELKSYVSSNSRFNGENWLCISSFSPLALEIFRNSLPVELKDRFDYVLILGYTGGWPKSQLAQAKGYVPEFNTEISSFVVQTEWLDCVWFSGQGIKDFNILFNKMISNRKVNHPEWQEVEFSFSTYQKKAQKMKKLMTKIPNLNVKIRSFMLDLDYVID